LKGVLKWVSIGLGGLAGLFIILVVVAAIASPSPDTKTLVSEPASIPALISTPTPEPVPEAEQRFKTGHALWLEYQDSTGLERRDLLERAIAEYSEAIRLDPHYAPPYIARGDAYNRLCQTGRAIDDYSKAIQLNPKLGAYGVHLAYFGRVLSYTDLGKHKEAQQDREAIEQAYDDYSPEQLLGRIDFLVSHPTPRECLPLPIKLMPPDAFGKVAEIRVSIPVAKLFGSEAEAHYARAVGFLQLGLFDEAQLPIAEAVRLGYDPEVFDPALEAFWEWRLKVGPPEPVQSVQGFSMGDLVTIKSSGDVGSVTEILGNLLRVSSEELGDLGYFTPSALSTESYYRAIVGQTHEPYILIFSGSQNFRNYTDDRLSKG
jgi:tetratricopeptide (TPR) repeat protein